MLADENARTQSLCNTIKAYWLEHGFPAIKAWPETVVMNLNRNATAIVVIRSNLGPTGYPPKPAALRLVAAK
jgi:hypothetical protein